MLSLWALAFSCFSCRTPSSPPLLSLLASNGSLLLPLCYYWASGHVSPVFKLSTLILNHTSPSPGTLMNIPTTTPTYHPYLCYRFHDYQEAVCNEILNMAETSVRYCSSLSHYPHGSLHRLHPHPSKQSLIISQQPQSHSSSPEPSRLHCGM